MAEPFRRQIGGEISLLPLPGIKVWSDDILGLFRRHRRPVQGPFVLIGRHKGLALETEHRPNEGTSLSYSHHTPAHGNSGTFARPLTAANTSLSPSLTASLLTPEDEPTREGIH